MTIRKSWYKLHYEKIQTGKYLWNDDFDDDFDFPVTRSRMISISAL